MTRTHFGSRPGGNSGHLRAKAIRRGPEKQSTVGTGRREFQQRTIDKWDAGADAYERKLAKQRAIPHAFEALGKLPSCAKCGMAKGQEWRGWVVHS